MEQKLEDITPEELDRMEAELLRSRRNGPHSSGAKLLPALRLCRVYRGLTMGELSEASGVHRRTIGELERGERGARRPTIRKLAAALEVEEETLYRDWHSLESEEDEKI